MSIMVCNSCGMVWGPMGPRCIKCSSYNVSQAGVGVSITDQPNPLPETSTLREQLVEMFKHDLYDLGASRVETNNLSHDWANMIADLIDQEKIKARFIELDLLEQALNAGRDLQAFKLQRLEALEALEKQSKK